MKTLTEYGTRLQSRRLADLKSKTASLERKLTQSGVPQAGPPAFGGGWDAAAAGPAPDTARRPGADAPPRSGQDRTEVLVNRGRRSAYAPGLSRRSKLAAATGLGVLLVTLLVILLTRGGASWPASVAQVQAETTRACQNPDVASEPGQVNFACGAATRQVLWVFALLTSGNNPRFSDPKTGRQGLEPIAPAQGGEVAWSLNLHHPYRVDNPVDSLQVAARAINNIIGGATLTSAAGKIVVQPGLESSAANCTRYTGSAALTTRQGFPSRCARPVTSGAGQAALVTDVYRKWVAGATPQAARNAAVLYQNASHPGDPAVQAILRNLSQAPAPD